MNTEDADPPVPKWFFTPSQVDAVIIRAAAGTPWGLRIIAEELRALGWTVIPPDQS